MVVIAASTLAAPVVARQLVHRPSAGDYWTYVNTYVGGSRNRERLQGDQAWVAGHRAEVMAQGRRACDWLKSQPDAPDIDASGRSEQSSLESRFLSETPTPGPLASRSRSILIAGAWTYMCWWDLHDKTAPRHEGHD